MRPSKVRSLLAGSAALLAAFLPTSQAAPIITSLVETGGDNEATDTITAKMTGQVVNNGIAGEFQIPYTVPLFGEDVYCYVDRTHQWNGITADMPLPAYLVGGEYIMIGNDNRDNAAFRLDITVSDQVIVYLLIDNRQGDTAAGTPPQNGTEIVDWTSMLWLQDTTFAPVKNGLNRTQDPNLPDEVSIDGNGDGVGPGVSLADYSSVYSAVYPAGTFSLFQADNAGQNMYGVVIKRAPGSINEPPQFTSISPTNNALSASSTAGLSFAAQTVSPNTIAASGIKLFLNGAEASGVTIGGTAIARTGTYDGLATNTLYRARLVATDQAGRSTTNDFAFDTFSATGLTIEAEDYNFGGGQVKSPLTPNAYLDAAGTAGIDYFDQNPVTLSAIYRTGDFVGFGTAGDVTRSIFTDASATDYAVNGVEAGEWLNYTRNIAAGTYNVYLRAGATAAQRAQLDKIAGATTTNQTRTPLGVFDVVAGAMGYTPLTDVGGRPLSIALSGDTTLRLTALSAVMNLNLNYLILVPAAGAATPAYVSSVGPVGPGISADANVTATVQNGGTTATGVTLFFDGADVSSQATVTPTASGFSGFYNPPGELTAGSVHNVQLIVQDSAGTKTTNSWAFTAASAVTLPANIKTALGTGAGSGFNVKISKIDNLITTLANTAVRAEQQLAGQIIDPTTLAPYDNQAAGPNGDGLNTNLVINFEQGSTLTDLAVPTGYIAGDELFPYIAPSVFGDPNNLALSADAYLELTAGPHRFGVRSDDGFRLSFGPTFSSSPLVAGVFEGGRGATIPGGATEFDVMVTEAGLYPAHLIYYEGNGGASLEFYTVDPITQTKIAVNDRSNPNAVKAYLARSTELFVPTVTLTAPLADAIYENYPTNIDLKADASVTGGTIVKVEFFESTFKYTNKIAEATSSPFSAVYNQQEPGHFKVWAKATDNQGFSSVSAAVNINVGVPLGINFQAATATTPDGYLADLGEIYGDRGNGYSYGWDVDNQANARERNSASSPDKRYDTFNHLQKPLPAGRVWEIELPNGNYKVVGASGDATATDSVFDVQVEGVTFISGIPVTGAWFADGMTNVVVSDGKLTISNGPLAANSKINFLDIYRLASSEQPKLTISRVTSNIQITWTGGGKLQAKADLNLPDSAWVDLGTTGAYTEPLGAGNKFFRVLK